MRLFGITLNAFGITLANKWLTHMNQEQNNESLKRAIQKKFESVSLTEDQLTDLQRAEKRSKQNDTANSGGGFKQRFLLPMTVAATIILAFMAALIFNDSNPRLPLTSAIAKEVRTNHVYNKPMDYLSDNAQNLLVQFDRLNFQPLITSPPDENWRLLGGRYCTLQGQFALLLRYQNHKNEFMTYYITRDSATFDNIPEHQDAYQEIASGLKVKLWQDSGLVSAIALKAG